MLVVETIGKIRRAYFVQGKSIKAICRELKLSRKVVRKVLRSGATSFEYEREVQPLPNWLRSIGRTGWTLVSARQQASALLLETSRRSLKRRMSTSRWCSAIMYLNTCTIQTAFFEPLSPDRHRMGG